MIIDRVDRRPSEYGSSKSVEEPFIPIRHLLHQTSAEQLYHAYRFNKVELTNCIESIHF